MYGRIVLCWEILNRQTKIGLGELVINN